MSALPPKADMCGANTNVRYGPKADIDTSRLFDHFIGAEQDGLGQFEAECLGGLAIEDELKLRHALDRKIGGIGAFKNFVHEKSRAAKDCNKVGSVTYYTTGPWDILRTNREKPRP